MEIDKIKSAFELTKEITNNSYVLVPILARKIKSDELSLMSYIKSNPKLFYTEPIWSYKEKTVYKRLWYNDPKSKYKTTESVKNKNLGLGIKNVYLKAEDNYRTDEWLTMKIKNSGKELHITEVDNYGHIQGYYLQIDDKNSIYRTGLWRNTLGKLEDLKSRGYLSDGTFVYGGFGDNYTQKVSYKITLDNIEKLKLEGWTFNNFKPLSK